MRQWIEDISRIVSRLDRAENKRGRRPRRFYLACSIRGALGLSSSGLASVPPANYATVGLKASFGQVFWNSFRGGEGGRGTTNAPARGPPFLLLRRRFPPKLMNSREQIKSRCRSFFYQSFTAQVTADGPENSFPSSFRSTDAPLLLLRRRARSGLEDDRPKST